MIERKEIDEKVSNPYRYSTNPLKMYVNVQNNEGFKPL